MKTDARRNGRRKQTVKHIGFALESIVCQYTHTHLFLLLPVYTRFIFSIRYAISRTRFP